MKKNRMGFKTAVLFTVAAALLAAVALYALREGREASGYISSDREDIAGGAQPKQRGKQEDRQPLISLGEEEGTVFISWKGDKSGPGYLRVSRRKDELPSSVQRKGRVQKAMGGRYYRYTAKVEGLEKGMQYYYEIGDGVIFESAGSFRTPEERDGMRFLYLGDVQFNLSVREYGRWENMTRKIYEADPQIQFAIIGGDMVNTPAEEEQWNGFLSNCSVFSHMPLMTVSGNHEGVRTNKTYKKIFTMPDNGPDDTAEIKKALQEDFYYFDCGSCRFIMTDSSFLTGERQKTLGEKRWRTYEGAIERWLRRTIEQSDRKWNIVVTHHPPYGMHDKNTVSPQLRKLWTPIMEETGADLVLCGHQHMYMRTKPIKGITYIMGNSGGRVSGFYNGYNAPAYCEAIYGQGPNYQIIDVDSNQLKITSYNKKGLIIDEAVIRKNLWFHIFEFFGCNKVIV